MSQWVAILEDNPRRIAEMKARLEDSVPEVGHIFFSDAREMIEWLTRQLREVILISLDHDLPIRDSGGEFVDCGTGRQVADFLASLPPTCPVIIHSSNADCAAGMQFALSGAGWCCSRVYPFDDLAWIRTSWASQVRKDIVPTHLKE